MNPPSLPSLSGEGDPIGVRHSKPSQRNPNEIVRESAGPEDLGHRPRRPGGLGVAHDSRRRQPLMAAAAGGVTGVNDASVWVDPVFAILAEP